MTTSRTPAQLREEIRARGRAPHGPERVTRAEELVAEADALADGGTREGRAALAEALLHLAASRAFGSAARSTPQVVARALRLRETHPDAFEDGAATALVWSLRWAVEDLLADPGTPQADIEEWLAAMARRHAGAGMSQRAVHAREFLAAVSFGDQARADESYGAWLAAERDGSADCLGCELAWRGRAHAARAARAEAAEPGSGAAEDEAALRMWEPVLRGEYPCTTQQPFLLADALLPLLRLGRVEEARSRHVAGYLLVRDAPTGRRAVARHLEFCARTGNEPRGLEILAEQDDARWRPDQDPGGYGAWSAAVALLMRRITARGHGTLAVPGPPGFGWTAAALAQYAEAQAQDVAERFDRRADGTHHRAALRTRLAAEPSTPYLPLGVGAAALPPEPDRPRAAGPTTAGTGTGTGSGMAPPAEPGTKGTYIGAAPRLRTADGASGAPAPAERPETTAPDANDTSAGDPPGTRAGVPQGAGGEARPGDGAGARRDTEAGTGRAAHAEVPQDADAGTPEVTSAGGPQVTSAGTPQVTSAGGPQVTGAAGPQGTSAEAPPGTEARATQHTEAQAPPHARAQAPQDARVQAPGRPRAQAPRGARVERDPRELFAEARRLGADGHPRAAALWAAVEEAVERTGLRLGPAQRAELLDQRAMETARTDPASGAARFAEAARLYASAGLPGEALACRARAVFSASYAPAGAAVPSESIDELCTEARRLYVEGSADTRQTTAVLLTRARMRARELCARADCDRDETGTPFDAANGAPHVPGPDADALDEELAALIALAQPDGHRPAVLAWIAEATETRGRLAAWRGDPSRAADLLGEAAGLFHAAGRPWAASAPEIALARLLMETGDHKRADEVLRGALEDDRGRRADRAPADVARLHLLHADTHAAQGLLAEEAESLRHAVHVLRSTDGGEATRARLRLGGCLLVLEQPDEAAAILVAALEELLAAADEPGIVQACVWLGQCCGRPEQLREAARLLHRAAVWPQPWQDRHGHAVVTHLAADTHRACGQYAAAGELYARAEELWRAQGDRHAVIRTLHARAWLAMEAGAPVEESLRCMDAAQHEIATALRDPEGELDDEQRLRLRLETGHTYRQTAELLIEPVPLPGPGEQGEAVLACYARGIEYADRAVRAFHACGEAGLHEATSAELRAAGLEADLGRYDEAVTRLTRVRAAYPDGTPDPHGTVAERMSEAGALELRIEHALS
ncbi:hypothetical protein G3260_000966 [Streptomyces albus]|uniref:hypothetical protein n=1 Tax=Streptomyces albus TaxID=1888 RepID=UPI0013B49282|nr:hypothetical protein [Streptomyces albus]QID35066.1 hypothetical protein G3260_000966 [Streptomyces albus]